MSRVAAVRFNISPVRALAVLAATLALTYVALIAVVMNYATLTVGFAESVRDGEAAVASLESSYFSMLQSVTATNYSAAGYSKPVAQVFVTGAPTTALR